MNPENLIPPSSSPSPPSRAWLGYVLPIVVFMAFTWIEGQAAKSLYPWLYMVKAIAVTVTLLLFRQSWRRDIRFDGRALVWGIVVGLVVFAEWVLIEKYIRYPHFGPARVSYNPFDQIANPAERSLFLAVRFYGLSLMVPVMEELFWRGFLLRYLTKPEWETLPIGAFSWGAFAIVAVGFALSHPEWLVALICAVAYGLLLRQTKSLFACIVAHGVTNFVLGLYIVAAHQWALW